MNKTSSTNEEIYVNIEFEYLMSSLFGNVKYHGDTGHKTISDWKGRLMKIIGSIENGIRYNVDSDEFHKEKLNLFCEIARKEIKNCNDINQINTKTIYCLVNIIFYLMGDMPDNWDLKSTNKINHWKLDNNRTLYYMQTPKQKANLILHLSTKSGYSDILPEYSELFKKRFYDFNKDDTKFIEWFKKTYTTAYMKIF